MASRGSDEFEAVAAAVRGQTRSVPLLASWAVRRKYSTNELRQASVFLWCVGKTVEPAGEECGTVYDETSACPVCHADARQVGAAFLCRKALRGDSDVRVTIGGEVILSMKARHTLVRAGVAPEMFGDVFIRQRGTIDTCDSHVQLLMGPPYLRVDGATKFGANPFADDGATACPRGDTAGLNILSELSIARDDALLPVRGLCHTATFVGARRGLLRPRRLTVVSRAVYDALKAADVSGCVFEIARQVD